jgi:hypothetical protein
MWFPCFFRSSLVAARHCCGNSVGCLGEATAYTLPNSRCSGSNDYLCFQRVHVDSRCSRRGCEFITVTAAGLSPETPTQVRPPHATVAGVLGRGRAGTEAQLWHGVCWNANSPSPYPSPPRIRITVSRLDTPQFPNSRGRGDQKSRTSKGHNFADLAVDRKVLTVTYTPTVLT